VGASKRSDFNHTDLSSKKGTQVRDLILITLIFPVKKGGAHVRDLILITHIFSVKKREKGKRSDFISR